MSRCEPFCLSLSLGNKQFVCPMRDKYFSLMVGDKQFLFEVLVAKMDVYGENEENVSEPNILVSEGSKLST